MMEFIMPSLGADMEDGTLAEWRKQPGDTVKRGDIIADVETQKGLIEIEVFDEGVIDQLLLEEGEKVPVGTVMALIRLKGETETTTAPAAATVATPPTADTVAPPVAAPMATSAAPERHPIQEKPMHAKAHQNGGHHRIKVSPLARVIAQKNHLDLHEIHGSGPGGAIIRKDVEEVLAHTGVVKAPIDAPTHAAPAEVEAPAKQPMPSKADVPKPAPALKPAAAGDAIRMAIASAMSKSKREIPHYYLEKRIDMTNAVSWLQETNKKRSLKERIMMPALLIKAVASALDDVPQLNAVWDDGLQIKDEINVGFVVALRSGGIVVPAIHSADSKSVDEIMVALNDLIPRAKALKLRSSELSDSTITLTSLGEGAADKVFGIIYPPQVAIVGFGGLSDQPFARNGMLGIAPVIEATLAGDHRASDGLTGSRFLTSLNNHLQNPGLL
jgi:pyruvate dehydrogenase E2 component (dihydrolipoamide acetyltransferase)